MGKKREKEKEDKQNKPTKETKPTGNEERREGVGREGPVLGQSLGFRSDAPHPGHITPDDWPARHRMVDIKKSNFSTSVYIAGGTAGNFVGGDTHRGGGGSL